MNTQIVTTGLTPLTINSNETFQLQPFANGLVWDLTGGAATLRMVDPNGVTYSYVAPIVGPPGGAGAQYTWTVLSPAGDWKRAWDITNAAGTRQVTRPIPFTVISSPS